MTTNAQQEVSGFLRNHRGPYRLAVVRPHPTKRGFFTDEMLPGFVDTADADEEALALLTDPRDTITSVYAWCPHEECWVGWWRR